ncbi:hypothetical protein ABER99_04025 [Paenibacillus glucanolyticus]|nr:hypothetical protein [Paenibacillus glucanolyticus]
MKKYWLLRARIVLVCDHSIDQVHPVIVPVAARADCPSDRC